MSYISCINISTQTMTSSWIIQTSKCRFKIKHIKISALISRSYWLTSYPLSTARWKDMSCMGMTQRIPCRQSTVWGSSMLLYAILLLSVSSLQHRMMGRPYETKVFCFHFLKNIWKTYIIGYITVSDIEWRQISSKILVKFKFELCIATTLKSSYDRTTTEKG